MTPEPTPTNPRLELQVALAEADAMAPPEHLRRRVLQAAQEHRPSRRAPTVAEAISPLEGYRRTVDVFGSLLDELSPEEWARPALRDLDVQGLVGHLIGVEHDFQASLRSEAAVPDASAPPRSDDHVGSTDATARAQAGRPAQATRRDWVEVSADSIAAVAGQPEAVLEGPVTLHGLTLSLEATLVVRAFELWTHEEDIRRATDRPLVAPDAARLGLMTGLALPLLEAGMARAGRSRPGRRAKLVLTGPGGRTWETTFGAGPGAGGGSGSANGGADVRIVVDAVSFCRVVADRLPPGDCGSLVTGDEALARDILVGAAALALD